ncbi:MAG TPA: CarD family transcriptional regulator [Spirochaetia bacterium]|nr:CarD family transcriptional regulator [Spirochaetales bacterium]HPD79590.1 CarD family transcriptional regulator [Spirochaetales bacterium]HQK35126.1 CarD family transcriptional regulator [Spirochaetales bacterium]HRS64445.1 CarD family transcriptional regulator [Spirochaetia bacterium]HRV27337.1 CarD family transcriptional regulator [Spirochaetia bacterium]
MSKARNCKYKINEQIVYPSQGVGKITDIVEKEFRENKFLYYVIYLHFSDMTVLVPVDKADELGIRPIVSKQDAEKALQYITEQHTTAPTDWKLRYQMNLDLLKKGSIFDISTVVRSLYFRSKVKELPILERKLYEAALNLLQDEIACALGKPKEEIAAVIREKLSD